MNYEIILNAKSRLPKEKIRAIVKKVFNTNTGLKYVDTTKIKVTHLTIKTEE
jgi:hypothetical protein